MSESSETAVTRSSLGFFPADPARDFPRSRADRSGVRAMPRHQATPVVDWVPEAKRRRALLHLGLYWLNTLGVLPLATLALLSPGSQPVVRRFAMNPTLATWFAAVLVACVFAVDIPRLWALSRRG